MRRRVRPLLTLWHVGYFVNILTSNSGDDRRPLVGSPQQDRRLVLTDRRFLGKSHNYFSTWKDGSTSELIMTFGDSLLQALGTGLCERSVPPIHSRRSRLCGPAAHSRASGRSLRMLGRRLEIGFLLTGAQPRLSRLADKNP